VLHCRGDRTASIGLGRELAAGILGAKFVPMEGDNHVFLEGEPARKTFFQEVSRFLGDKPHLISKGALKRQARGFNATMQHLHHVIHPYYVVIAVASAVFGLVSFVLTKIV